LSINQEINKSLNQQFGQPAPQQFIRAAVTGPIGSGKTFLTQKLQEKGAIIISWDEIYANLIKTDEILRSQIIEAFSLSAKSNIINELKKIIFGSFNSLLNNSESNYKCDYNKTAITILNNITHPIIAKKAWEMETNLLIEYSQKGQLTPNPDDLYPLVVHEIPLLYQSPLYDAHLDSKFDRIYICLASDKTLIQRVMQRDNLSLLEAKKRLEATKCNFPIQDPKVIVVNS
jgi:dephospho-CoA kinase